MRVLLPIVGIRRGKLISRNAVPSHMLSLPKQGSPRDIPGVYGDATRRTDRWISRSIVIGRTRYVESI